MDSTLNPRCSVGGCPDTAHRNGLCVGHIIDRAILAERNRCAAWCERMEEESRAKVNLHRKEAADARSVGFDAVERAHADSAKWYEGPAEKSTGPLSNPEK